MRNKIISACVLAAGVASSVFYFTRQHPTPYRIPTLTDSTADIAPTTSTCPTGATCWKYLFNGLSGTEYSNAQTVALVETNGNPIHQIRTGLFANGGSRTGMYGPLGVHYDTTNCPDHEGTSVEGSPSALMNFTAGMSIEGIIRPLPDSSNNYTAIAGNTHANRVNGTGSGILIYYHPNETLLAIVGSDATHYKISFTNINPSIFKANVIHSFHVAFPDAGAGEWGWPVIYVDGVATTSNHSGVGTVSGTIVANYPFAVGGNGDHDFLSWAGDIFELRVANKAYSAGEVLAHYKETLLGSYWASDGDIAHYKFQQGTYADGLIDSSGNGNHLTAKTCGPPTPTNSPMPYPGGTNFVFGTSSVSNEYYLSNTDIGPRDGQSWSMIAWMRAPKDYDATYFGIIQPDTPGYAFYITTSPAGYAIGTVTLSGGLSAAVEFATAFDDVWHIYAFRIDCATGPARCRPCMSHDGSAFSCSAYVTGTIEGGTPALQFSIGASRGQLGPVSITRNYAVSNAEIAAYAAAVGMSGAGYTRSGTSCYEVKTHPVAGVIVRCVNGAQKGPVGLTAAGTTATNLLTYSRAVSNAAWTNTNSTDAANSEYGPDGLKSADTVTATAANGTVSQNVATIAATTHTYCQYLRRNGYADVAGDIRLVKNSDNTEIAKTSYTATNAWQRFCVSGTAVLNDTRVETRVTTNALSVFVDFAQLSATAAWPGFQCPTTTDSVACN